MTAFQAVDGSSILPARTIMEQVPEQEAALVLGNGKYKALQLAIAAVLMEMDHLNYPTLGSVFEDTPDDMRHIIQENNERVIAAFQGQESFSSIGQEDLIRELALKVLERAPTTKGQW